MFDFLYSIWLEFLFRPIFNLVVFTYNISPGPNLGLAIIGLAIFIRFIFLYFTLKGYKQDEKLAEHKPEIEKIEQDKTLTSREKIKKVSQLTKPLGINPIYSAIPVFAQVVFLGVLYQIIQGGRLTGENFDHLYSFVGNPETINTMFLGYDLTKSSLILSLVGAFALLVERIWEYREKKDVSIKTFSQKWDPLIWPLGTFIILMILPSAKAVFLSSSVLFSMAIKTIMHVRK